MVIPYKRPKNTRKTHSKNDKRQQQQTKKIVGIYTPGDVRPMEQRSSPKMKCLCFLLLNQGKVKRVSGTEKFQFNIATASRFF